MEEKYKIHFFYIISMLVSVIVILMTVEWSNIPGLKDYISFALTVFSIGLAVLAIIYSIYSNSTLSSSLSLLESSSLKLSETSNTLSKSTEKLTDNIVKIPTAIGKVEDRVTETHSLIEELRLSSSTQSVNVTHELSASYLGNFIQVTSYNSLITLYVLHHSYANQAPISFNEELLELMEVELDDNHIHHLLMKAMGLFKSKVIDGTYLCTDFHPYFDDFDKIISDKCTEIFEEHPDLIERNMDSFKKLKNYLIANYI